MSEAWKSALERAILSVFESLCFMLSAPRNSVLPEPEPGSRVVLVVAFSGAGRGHFHLVLPESMIGTIASAMLGEDGPLSLAEQYDAAAELANVVCGNALPLVAGERAVFDLASPQVTAALDSGLGEEADASVAVRLEDGVVYASLSLRMEERQGAA